MRTMSATRIGLDVPTISAQIIQSNTQYTRRVPLRSFGCCTFDVKAREGFTPPLFLRVRSGTS